MSNPKNKWSQPQAPPAPMFFGKKERDLVKQVNDELSERIIGQPIAYYPISIEESNFNDTYGEALEKVSLPPIRVYAYVEVENEQTNQKFGYEYQTKLTVNFHRRRLIEDQDLYVRVGDFVQYGDEFYEIVRLYNDTRYLFGQVEHKFQVTAECVRARRGTFRVMPGIDRPVIEAEAESTPDNPPPRIAPYPPLEATYITATPARKLPNERVLTAGSGITIVDGGPNGNITVSSTAASAVGSPGSIQISVGDGTFYGDSKLLYNTSSNNLTITGELTASVLMSSSAVHSTFLTSSYINLQPVTGTLAGLESYLGLDANNNIIVTSSIGIGAATGQGPAGSLQFQSGSGQISGSGNILFLTASNTLQVLGDITASVNISASAFYGDGSNLTGITTAPAGSDTQIQFNNAGAFGSSTNLTYDSSANFMALTGTMALSGGLIHKRVEVITSYTASANDYFLAVTGVPTSILFDATSFSAGQVIIIKDESGNASVANKITLSPGASQTIDGAGNLLISSPYGSVLLYSNGSNWFIY